MARAIWNGKVLAESDRFETVENNVYFPPESLNQQYFKPSETTSFCIWKGKASYLTVAVEGQEIVDAAWYYPEPKSDAANIKGHVAFWRGVTIER